MSNSRKRFSEDYSMQNQQPASPYYELKFPSELPIPGCVYWFDAHCYYEEVGYQPPCGTPPRVPGPTPPPSPCARLVSNRPCPCPPPKDEHPVEIPDPCSKTPCKLDPCKKEKPAPQPPPEICEPCREEDPKKKC